MANSISLDPDRLVWRLASAIALPVDEEASVQHEHEAEDACSCGTVICLKPDVILAKIPPLFQSRELDAECFYFNSIGSQHVPGFAHQPFLDEACSLYQGRLPSQNIPLQTAMIALAQLLLDKSSSQSTPTISTLKCHNEALEAVRVTATHQLQVKSDELLLAIVYLDFFEVCMNRAMQLHGELSFITDPVEPKLRS